jgi:hypothetical protein
MGMTVEEQRSAALRILMAHPLTAEERRVAEVLRRRPEEYGVPNPEHRICVHCGSEFKTMPGIEGMSAMQQFTDHMSFHNPSPAKWAEAHKRIQEGKQMAKSAQ